MNIDELVQRLSKYLTTPGDGIFTRTFQKGKRAFVQNYAYNSTNRSEILHQILDNNVLFLGVPHDAGQGVLRGTNWGPLFIREALIKERSYPSLDLGDIKVIPHLLHDSLINDTTLSSCRKSLYQDENLSLPVSPLSILEDLIHSILSYDSSKKLLTLGGDHSTTGPILKEYLKKYPDLAVIHFDAHTDLLQERLGISHNFSTWAYEILEYMKTPSNLIQVGIQNSAHHKSYWETELGVTQFWSDEINKEGITKISNQIVSKLKANNVSKIYITLDMDVFSHEYVGAVGNLEMNGLQPHEPMTLLHELANSFEIIGADIVELAPLVKHPETRQPEPGSSLMIATSFVTYLYGVMKNGHR